LTLPKLNIPIVMLHHVADHPHPSLKKWCISHLKFLELLDNIELKGLVTTTFQEIIELKPSRKELKKRVIISFDDCPASLFDFVIQELLKRKMKAVFYIPTNHIGGVNIWDIEEYNMSRVELMNTSQLRELVSLGMEVGSHGEKHIKLNAVTEMEVLQDISDSKEMLELLLESPVYSFAYPYGKIPANYGKLLTSAGYTFGLSIYTPIETNFTLRRFAINQGDDGKNIRLKLGKRYRLMRLFYDPLFFLLRKL
jgi:peptidoglycan/xylan/chitin deacetylase (PgdA/CDA1 family)